MEQILITVPDGWKQELNVIKWTKSQKEKKNVSLSELVRNAIKEKYGFKDD